MSRAHRRPKLGRAWAGRPPRPAQLTNETRIYRAFLPPVPFAAERLSGRRPLDSELRAAAAQVRDFIGEKSKEIPTPSPYT
jgi:hypothetical protein